MKRICVALLIVIGLLGMSGCVTLQAQFDEKVDVYADSIVEAIGPELTDAIITAADNETAKAMVLDWIEDKWLKGDDHPVIKALLSEAADIVVRELRQAVERP